MGAFAVGNSLEEISSLTNVIPTYDNFSQLYKVYYDLLN